MLNIVKSQDNLFYFSDIALSKQWMMSCKARCFSMFVSTASAYAGAVLVKSTMIDKTL